VRACSIISTWLLAISTSTARLLLLLLRRHLSLSITTGGSSLLLLLAIALHQLLWLLGGLSIATRWWLLGRLLWWGLLPRLPLLLLSIAWHGRLLSWIATSLLLSSTGCSARQTYQPSNQSFNSLKSGEAKRAVPQPQCRCGW